MKKISGADEQGASVTAAAQAQRDFSARACAAMQRRGALLEGTAAARWQQRLARQQSRLQALSLTPAAAGDEHAGSLSGGSASVPSAPSVQLRALRLQLDGAAAPIDAAAHEGALPPLKALQRLAPQWAALRRQLRLQAALAGLPVDAGPLNSHQLMAQCLRQLEDIAPAYLEHFMDWGEMLLRLPPGLDRVLAQSASEKGRTRRRSKR